MFALIMPGRYTDLEFEFILEILDQHGEYLSDLLVESISRKTLIDQGVLVDDIHFRVAKYGQNPVLQFSFLDYGRFIEIRYHSKSRNTTLWRDSHREARKAILGRQVVSRNFRRKKDTRWYAKNVYGSVNRLIGKLMYEFTEEEKQRLHQILELRKSSRK